MLALFLMLVCVTLLWMWKEEYEYFAVYPDMEERVIAVFEDVLQRQPSSTELINSVRDIKNDVISWDGLRQRLMDTQEYERMIKLQSNTLAPELDKMLADSRLIKEVSAIYRQVKQRDIPNHMILPLRDLYTTVDYNPYTLAAILKDKKYDAFEQDIRRARDLDKNGLIEMYTKQFNQVEIAKSSAEIAKSPEAVAIASVATTNNNPTVAAATTAGQSTTTTPSTASATTTTAPSGPANTLSAEEQRAIREVLQVLGASPDGKVACPVDKQDSCMSPMAQKIQDNARRVFDIHDAARRIEQPHKGQMVLRPEFAWSVPQSRPPVCNSLGRAPLVQPLMNDSKLLLGTPLEQAADTEVGSIMPKFDYKEYVDVPVTTA